jgi:hypothetical protein
LDSSIRTSSKKYKTKLSSAGSMSDEAENKLPRININNTPKLPKTKAIKKSKKINKTC